MTTPATNPSIYECTADVHLLKYGAITIAVYNLMYRLSKNSGRFFGTVIGIADHLSCDRTSVQRAIQNLIDDGFIIQVASGKESYSASTYRVVSHKEWAKTHIGCRVKGTIASADPLSQQMYMATDGKIHFGDNQIKNFRGMGLTDEVILDEFNRFIESNRDRMTSKRWCKKGAAMEFYFRLKPMESSAV